MKVILATAGITYSSIQVNGQVTDGSPNIQKSINWMIVISMLSFG